MAECDLSRYSIMASYVLRVCKAHQSVFGLKGAPCEMCEPGAHNSGMCAPVVQTFVQSIIITKKDAH